MTMQRPYRVSCHCGALRIDVDTELTDLHECNCSMCGRHGFIHWKVRLDSLRLVEQKRSLTAYLWRDVTGHEFCSTCGTGMLRKGYAGDRVSVNATH
jgi:hypothetical protein